MLGQIAFQEHFPIDGIAQDAVGDLAAALEGDRGYCFYKLPLDFAASKEPSKSTKPMPRWAGKPTSSGGRSGLLQFGVGLRSRWKESRNKVYGLGACTAFMTLVTVTAWYQAKPSMDWNHRC